ncbi:MAG: benzoate/H(+) symporter BenE family transporter [Acetobacteraceae bacterium]|nr:benzoate/H(+) symporter BenE family transporter [Acetobacteraceae bacterium]
MQRKPPPHRPREQTHGRLLGEVGGACGDLGTFIPHVVGALTVAGLAPAGVLFGFGAAFVASGLFYGVPMAVQPMKAVGAVLLTGQLTPGATAAAGLVVGAVLLLLGATGLITKLARLVPQSVTAGLQLGLGITMGWLGLTMIAETPWIGVPALALLFGLPRLSPRMPVAPLVLLGSVVVGATTGQMTMPAAIGFDLRPPPLTLPDSWGEVWQAVELAVVPQLPLTLTNAVIVTAALCRDLFPERAGRATVRNLALTSGVMNLMLAPFGAMPMCHGAGGVAAQHRFGARTGLAPVMMGAALLALALGSASGAAAVFAAIPASAVGALLLVAGTDLAMSKRLFDARLNCWPAIVIAAGVTAPVNPAVGLAAGWAVELVRAFARASRRISKAT